MSPTAWVELRVQIDDDDPDFDRLSRSEQQDVAHAVRTFARTGRGGTVTMHAPGSIDSDVLRAGRIEIDVEIRRDHPKGPTLVVTGFSIASDALDD